MASVEDDDDALFAELYGIDEGKKSKIPEGPEVSVKPVSQELPPYLPEQKSLNWEGNQAESSDAHRAEYEVEYQGQQDEDLGIKIVLESGNNTTNDGNSAPGQLYHQPPHVVDANKTSDINGYQPRPNRYVRPELQSQNSNGSQAAAQQRPPAEAGAPPSFSTSPSGPTGQNVVDTNEKSQLQGIGPTGRSRPRRFTPQIQVKNVFELDIDTLEEKPWRRPGEDVSDYFNYDLTEGTWKEYVRKYNEAKKDAALREQHQEQIHVLDGDNIPSGPRPTPNPLPTPPQGRGRGRAMAGGPPTFMSSPRPYMPPNFMMARGYERPPLPMAPKPPMPWGGPAMQRAPPLPPGRPPSRPPVPFTPTMYMGADKVHSNENGGREKTSSDFSESNKRSGSEETAQKKKEKPENDHKGFSGSDYLAKHESSRREKDSKSSYTSRKGSDRSTKSRYERDSREREREYSHRDRPRDRDRRRDRSRERDKEKYSYDRRRSYSPSSRDRSGHRS